MKIQNSKKFMEEVKENFLEILNDRNAIAFGKWLMFSDVSDRYQRHHRIDPKMDGSHFPKMEKQIEDLYKIFKNPK